MACAPLDGPPGCLRANGLVPGRARTPADTFASRGHRLFPSSPSVAAAAAMSAPTDSETRAYGGGESETSSAGGF